MNSNTVGILYLFSLIWSLKKLIFEIFLSKGICLERFQTKSGSWAIVTGASEGIGREFSLQLAQNRFNIILIARSKDKLKALSKEIENTYAIKTIVHIMDFSIARDEDYEELERIIENLDIRVLINNVGLSHEMPTPFTLTTPCKISDIITVNCIATLKITKLVIPKMIIRKNGLILTMSSFSGITPTPLLATYSGSKAFLTTWSQALAEELKSEGIVVQAINSYFVVSAMSKIQKSSFFVPTPKQFVKTVLCSIGLQRGAATPYTMTPYPSHSILNWFLENVAFKLSRSYLLKHNLKTLQKIRSRALQKQSSILMKKDKLDKYDLKYYDSYAHHGIHEEMLKDEIRTLSYRDAIYQNKDLFHDKVVLDVGCGTGILSMFAAKAGARLVIGVDMSDIIHQAEKIIKINGMSDKILLIKGRMEDITLPVEKVDIIVSEWMGYFLLYESMLEAVIFARDAYLKKDGLMFPSKAIMFIAGIEDAEYKQEKIGFWSDVYGFDFTPIQELAMKEPLVDTVEFRAVVTDPYRLLALDLYNVKKENLSFVKKWELKARRKDYIHAIIAWFDIEFEGSHKPVKFSTGPHAKYTHWRQTVFYLNDVISEGEIIHGTITNVPNQKNRRDLDITIEYTFNKNESSINNICSYMMLIHGCSFKKRAPYAIKCIRKFATLHMGTKDVRIDPQLNKEVFKRGIKGVPYRLRLRLSRKRNDEENTKERLYTYVQVVNVPDGAKGLQTTGLTGLLGLGTYHVFKFGLPFSRFFGYKWGHSEPIFVDNKEWIDLTLSKITDFNHNCKIFRFDFPSKKSVSGLQVASALLTKFESPSQPTVIRAYTPISHEETQGYLELLIKKYENGPMSSHIHDMKINDKLSFKGPILKYPWNRNMHDRIVLIAGGTGITPMYQLIRKIFQDKEDKTDITEKDILLRKEFQQLKKKHQDRFHVIYILDNPPENWKGVSGRINKDLLKLILPDPLTKNIKIFVCGPPGFYQAISGMKRSTDQGELEGFLKELGYSKEQVM
ncbi:hypothetical protein PCANB_002247 [Pneumocystis canis]|nr:hypothetical protein PCANB_002247 [Pneumocystis canis]